MFVAYLVQKSWRVPNAIRAAPSARGGSAKNLNVYKRINILF